MLNYILRFKTLFLHNQRQARQNCCSIISHYKFETKKEKEKLIMKARRAARNVELGENKKHAWTERTTQVDDHFQLLATMSAKSTTLCE